MAHSLEARVPFLDPVGDELRARAARRGTRCVASRRRCCCARRSSRSCRARSCAAASAASRSLPPRGCAASSSRSRARRCAPETLRRQGYLPARGGDARCSTSTSPAARTSRASSGGCSRSRSGTSATSSESPRRSRARAWRRSSADRPPGARARLPAEPSCGDGSSTPCSAGEKTATAGLHGVFEDEPTPSPGDRFVMRRRQGRLARRDRRGDRGASDPRRRDRPAVRPRRGRGVRVGAGLARGPRALLRADDRAGRR